MNFQWPLCLLFFLLLPLIMLIYLQAQKRRHLYAVRFTNLALLESVVGKGPGMRRHIPAAFFLIALGVLIFGLARPTATLALPLRQANVMLVFDVSGSMMTQDMSPNRITAAKQAANAFIKALSESVQVGIISFNSVAVLRAPLTHDRAVVQQAIAGLVPGGGTAIGDGLDAALDQLQQAPHTESGAPPPATIVLLSDGANNTGSDPALAIQRAHQEHIKVDTIGIGVRNSLAVNDNPQNVGLDETALKAIASQTSGHYFYASETKALQQIYTDLSSQISWVKQPFEITALLSLLGILCFLISGFLSLYWFQRFP